MNRRLQAVLGCSFAAAMLLAAATPAMAQLSREQLDKVRNDRAQRDGVTYSGKSDVNRSPTRHLNSTIIEPVALDSVKARDAFTWWSNTTGIPLVINWRELEASGVDPDTRIDLNLRSAPAASVLALLLKQITFDQPLMYETTSLYIRILSKAQADKETVTLVYDIKDLIVKIPSFTNAPSFDLNDALSNTSSGGSSGGAQSSTTLFGEGTEKEEVKSDAEKGEEIASLIREMIEPSIWQELGGQHSSVRYFHGRLIIKAPRYVHAQIGFPVSGGGRSTDRVGNYSGATTVRPVKGTDVAGVRENQDKVGGVAGQR